jgi:hypothetical protein
MQIWQGDRQSWRDEVIAPGPMQLGGGEPPTNKRDRSAIRLGWLFVEYKALYGEMPSTTLNSPAP